MGCRCNREQTVKPERGGASQLLGSLSRSSTALRVAFGEEADDVASLTVPLVRGTLPGDL
jgi:hypothetical protein